ncbi:MAG: UDP-N-acetylmuramoyl-tripeptide--D-alanyl-D-alanine ligase [Gammaproteobacteria bacterium]
MMVARRDLADAGLGEWTGVEARGEFRGVSTDTRTIKPGQLFVALVGERFDGHQFLSAACEAGACAVVVQRDALCTLPTGVPCLRVLDTGIALGELARLWRNRLTLTTIALTGSCGKTTVKEMLGAILRVAFEADQSGADQRVLLTAGNLNNQIGLPLTVCRLHAEHTVAVLELGANHEGEIAWTAGICRPDIAVITNVGQAHLAGFGSVEVVARAKGEIYDALTPQGTAVINLDDAFAPQWLAQNRLAQNRGRRCLTFTLYNTKSADVVLEKARYRPGYGSILSIRTPKGVMEVETPLLGEHNWSNVLAVVSALQPLNVSAEAIRTGLAAVKPVRGRLSPVVAQREGCVLIDDTYNANPSSVRAAVDVLATCKGWRVLVLGSMAELGDQAADLHREVARYARDRLIDELVAIGEFASDMAQGFAGCRVFSSHDEAIAYLQALPHQSSAILVKGSRSARMEKVVSALARVEMA